MTDAPHYFGTDTGAQEGGSGSFVQWDALAPIEMVPGLFFQPVVGDRVMTNFVRFDPNTEAPMHWHEEEQISFVLEGELEFEVAGETRVLTPGQAVVIPPNVPHGARTHDGPCLEVDVFHPPRRALLETMGTAEPE
jgi:quercetin dioxygenase-like cupin family protein